MRQDLYNSDTLRVFSRKGHHSRQIVVTFQSLFDTHWECGFGEDFLASLGIDAIHVIPRSNQWYQYSDMPQAAEIIRAASNDYEEVVTYGLSMGGYAAINFSGDVRAHRAIAISPQYSVDPTKVGFEQRWESYVASIRFCCDKISCIEAPPKKVHIVYDPWNQDRRHVDLMAPFLPLDRVHIPFGWHPASGVLIETGLLSRLVGDLLRNTLDRAVFMPELRAASRRSPAFHAGLAETLSWSKPRLKVALYRRAAALAPGNGKYRRDLAILLLFAGQPAEALELMERERQQDPTYPYLPFYISKALNALGRKDEAIEAAKEAVELSPDFPMFTTQLQGLMARSDLTPPSVTAQSIPDVTFWSRLRILFCRLLLKSYAPRA